MARLLALLFLVGCSMQLRCHSESKSDAPPPAREKADIEDTIDRELSETIHLLLPTRNFQSYKAAPEADPPQPMILCRSAGSPCDELSTERYRNKDR